MKLDDIRNLNHVSLSSDFELDMLGFSPEDDVSSMCPSLVVEDVYSADENCYWPKLACQAILDAEMLLNHESCSWFPRDSDYDTLPF